MSKTFFQGGRKIFWGGEVPPSYGTDYYFVFNAMATTAYHNQSMRDLDKKCTILFLYGSASYSCAQFSYAL